MQARGGHIARRVIVPGALLTALLAASGCGKAGIDTTADTGPGDTTGDGAPAGAIGFEGDAPLVLSPGQERRVEGRYLDPAGAPAATRVTLSLVGEVYDSMLRSTAIDTDAWGRFSIGVVAGSVITRFSLRAVAPDGARGELGVEVVSPGKGSIVVEPSYEGRRRVDRVGVRLYERTGCPPAGAPAVFLDAAADAGPVTIPHLPEETPMALLVEGLYCRDPEDTAGCLAWVRGCVGEVEAAAGDDGAAAVQVVMTDDTGFFGHESFGTFSVLAAGELLAPHVAALTAPLAPLAASDEEAARYVLDGIQHAVVVAFGEGAGDVFLAARLAAGLDEAVASSLAGGSGGIADEIAAVQSALLEQSRLVYLEGTLEKDLWPADPGERLTASHLLGRVVVGGVDVMPAITGSTLGLESTLEVSYALDRASLGPHSFPLGGGKLLAGAARRAVLPALVDPSAPEISFPDWLVSMVDCGLVGDALYGNAEIASLVQGEADKASWYRDRCAAILDAIALGIDGAASRADLALPRVGLEGSADFLEEDGAPREGGIGIGAWTGATWGDGAFADTPALLLKPVDPVD